MDTQRQRRVRRLVASGLLVALLPLPGVASRTAAALRPQVEGVVTRVPPPPGTMHPSVPGMFFFGEHGWGRLTFDVPPPELRTVLVATPWYSDATSRSRIALAESLLGEPVLARSSPQVPDEFDGHRRGCRYLDPSTGAVAGYDDSPCEHRNKWARGPQDGFSYCVYKSCQTRGHGSQGRWSTFLAHSEIWAYVESFTPAPIIGFVPCGPACELPFPDETPTATSVPPTSVPPTSVPPTSVPPTSVPPDAGDPDGGGRSGGGRPDPGSPPVDPCTLPGVDCQRPVCGRSGDCVPRCGDVPCPPPSLCEIAPGDVLCTAPPEALDGVSVRVVLTVPEVFVARGTLAAQGAVVTAVELRCGAVPCPRSLPGVVRDSVKVTGTLTLVPPGPRYRVCVSQAPCEFRMTHVDVGPHLEVGDRVSAVFFTPTRSGEWLRVSAGSPTATIDVQALLPVLAWERTAEGFTLVPTGEQAWGYARSVPVPVRVVTSDGAVVGDDGLRRLVIGTVGG